MERKGLGHLVVLLQQERGQVQGQVTGSTVAELGKMD
jgi:hypothetical protein